MFHGDVAFSHVQNTGSFPSELGVLQSIEAYNTQALEVYIQIERIITSHSPLRVYTVAQAIGRSDGSLRSG